MATKRDIFTEPLVDMEYQRGYKDGYAKAIEEFAEKLIRHFADWQMSEDDVQIKYIITQACEGVEEIAEQLKGE